MTYFDDIPQSERTAKASKANPAGKARHGKAKPADTAALVKESLRLYYSLTDRDAQKELEDRLGPTPTPKDPSERSWQMSMWLAAACVASLEACKQQAGELLATKSTVERLRRVLKVQGEAAAKKYSR